MIRTKDQKRIVNTASHQAYIHNLSKSIELLDKLKEECDGTCNKPDSIDSLESNSDHNDFEQIDSRTNNVINSNSVSDNNESTNDKTDDPVEYKAEYLTNTDKTLSEKNLSNKKYKKRLKPWVKYVSAGLSAVIVILIATTTAGQTFSKKVENQDAELEDIIVEYVNVEEESNDNSEYINTENDTSDTEESLLQEISPQQEMSEVIFETEKQRFPGGIPSDVRSKFEIETESNETANIIPSGIPSDVLEKITQRQKSNDVETQKEETKSEENNDSQKEREDLKVERPEPLGTKGRLYFDNGWSVALNYADSYDTEEMQKMADAYDSACYMEDSGKVIIADHASQGFEIIKKYDVGTKAVIVDENGDEREIECTALYLDAYWEDGYTHLPDGRGIWGSADGEIGMQTSNNEEGTSITISYWNYVA